MDQNIDANELAERKIQIEKITERAINTLQRLELIKEKNVPKELWPIINDKYKRSLRDLLAQLYIRLKLAPPTGSYKELIQPINDICDVCDKFVFLDIPKQTVYTNSDLNNINTYTIAICGLFVFYFIVPYLRNSDLVLYMVSIVGIVLSIIQYKIIAELLTNK